MATASIQRYLSGRIQQTAQDIQRADTTRLNEKSHAVKCFWTIFRLRNPHAARP